MSDSNEEQFCEKTVLDAIKKLKKNPLYWMSAGARENSFSYFFKWMFDTYPDSLKILDNTITSSAQSVKRELHNMDLIIEFDDGVIIVENKIKSLSTADQLQRYNEKLENKFKDKKLNKILLSMIKPAHELHGWTYLSYQELTGKIFKFLSNSTDVKSNHKQYIDDMMDVFKQSMIIMQAYEKKSGFWFDIDKNCEAWKALEDIRFEDTVTKFLASEFHNYIYQNLPEEIKGNPHFRSGAGMQRKSASVDFYFTTAQKGQKISETDVILFVQIEAATYRRAIEYKEWKLTSVKNGRGEKCLSEKLSDEKFKASADRWIPKWKDMENKLLVFRGKTNFKTSMTKSYGSYQPGFIYRYLNIGGKGGMQVKDLKEYILADLELASNIFQDLKLP